MSKSTSTITLAAAVLLGVAAWMPLAAQQGDAAVSPAVPVPVVISPAPPPASAPEAATGGAITRVPALTQAEGLRDSRTYGMSWREAWNYGGVIMWFILALSILGGALAIYLFFYLRPAQIAPRSLLSEVCERLNEGDLNAARRACDNRACPLAAVTLAALDYIRNASDPNAPLLRDIIETEGARQADEMQSQTQYLLDISVVSPMLGLLGTVLGMLTAFGSITQEITAAKPVILAQGVSQAIVTTIFGLMVAIPSMVLYAYFRRRASRMVSLLEASMTSVVTSLSGRPRA